MGFDAQSRPSSKYVKVASTLFGEFFFFFFLHLLPPLFPNPIQQGTPNKEKRDGILNWFGCIFLFDLARNLRISWSDLTPWCNTWTWWSSPWANCNRYKPYSVDGLRWWMWRWRGKGQMECRDMGLWPLPCLYYLSYLHGFFFFFFC